MRFLASLACEGHFRWKCPKSFSISTEIKKPSPPVKPSKTTMLRLSHGKGSSFASWIIFGMLNQRRRGVITQLALNRSVILKNRQPVVDVLSREAEARRN